MAGKKVTQGPKSKAQSDGKGLTNYNLGGIYNLYRQLTPFVAPEQMMDGNTWRRIARSQPIIADCITSLSMYIQGLPYDIQARESSKNDKFKEDIKYYKDLLDNCQDGAGFLTLLDFFVQDFYQIPFGVGIESPRYSDGRLYTLRVLDGATLYPYNNVDYPVVQYVPEVTKEPVYFKSNELIRDYQSPRPELYRRGWQIAQPERIYLALDLLNRGDRYYANLLLDTPESGILDLGDMSAESAKKWLESFKNLFTGIDPFKVPVIYEHTTPAKYIPFNRPPTELMFDSTTLKYAEIAVASFGITLGDIGMKAFGGGGGASLASSIRDERHSKGTGKQFLKTHVERLINQVLPDELKFFFVDTDDESLANKGRARSANAVAFRNLVEGGILTPDESRKQLMADGLITIPLADQVDPNAFEIVKDIAGITDQTDIAQQQVDIQKKQVSMQSSGGSASTSASVKSKNQGGRGLNSRRDVRGAKLQNINGKDNVNPSQGGMGEIKSEINNDLRSEISTAFDGIIQKMNPTRLNRLIKMTIPKVEDILKSSTDQVWRSNYTLELFDQPSGFENPQIVRNSINLLSDSLHSDFEKDKWWMVSLNSAGMADYLAKSYTHGLEDAAVEIQKALYESGYSNELEPISNFELTNIGIYNDLDTRVDVLEKSINEGTLYYLTRLSVDSILQTFESYQSLYETDNNVIKSDGFINDVSSNLMPSFIELLKERSDMITNYESGLSYNQGILKQYSSVGIGKKYLIHVGEDEPCDVCKANMDIGEVDLDYEYTTKFKSSTSAVPPIHPNDHCRLSFSRSNLENINGNYYTGD